LSKMQQDSLSLVMICNHCKETFTPTHFNQKCCSVECRKGARVSAKKKYKKSEKGLASIRRLYGSDKKLESDRRYRQTDGAKKMAVIRSARTLKNSPSLQEKKRIRDAAFAKTERGREFNRKAAKIYRQTEKGRFASLKGKYRRRNSVAGVLDRIAWADKLLALNGECQMCGTTHKITIDHIIPLSKGGTNHIDNLQPLCHSCNASKGDKIQNNNEAQMRLRAYV